MKQLKQKSMKWALGMILPLALNAATLSPQAWAGGESGGGGDAVTEMRIDEIRADILKWIDEGGGYELKLPADISIEVYRAAMSRFLERHAVVIGAVTTAEENATSDPELKVIVADQPKTCRGFVSVKDQRPHILCNVERFTATPESKQYSLIHHEYAGLARLEQNLGASSDYSISNQITDYLVSETVLRLAVKKTQMPSNHDTQTQANGMNVKVEASTLRSYGGGAARNGGAVSLTLESAAGIDASKRGKHYSRIDLKIGQLGQGNHSMIGHAGFEAAGNDTPVATGLEVVNSNGQRVRWFTLSATSGTTSEKGQVKLRYFVGGHESLNQGIRALTPGIELELRRRFGKRLVIDASGRVGVLIANTYTKDRGEKDLRPQLSAFGHTESASAGLTVNLPKVGSATPYVRIEGQGERTQFNKKDSGGGFISSDAIVDKFLQGSVNGGFVW